VDTATALKYGLYGLILQYNLKYAFIDAPYHRSMQKSVFPIVNVIALVTILLIPTSPTHIAKASSCNASSSNGQSGSAISSGSCSTSISVSRHAGSLFTDAGPKSICTSASSSQISSDSDADDSNGGVSCSSHSP
jgi:hypothetical protein